MTNADVAQALVDLCRKGDNLEVIDKYYASDIVSVESASGPGMSAESQGIEAVKGKNQWWLENHEIHSAEISEPLLGKGDQFAVYFKYDVTQKANGQRFTMEEMGLYTIKNGKIAREHFFYKV